MPLSYASFFKRGYGSLLNKTARPFHFNDALLANLSRPLPFRQLSTLHPKTNFLNLTKEAASLRAAHTAARQQDHQSVPSHSTTNSDSTPPPTQQDASEAEHRIHDCDFITKTYAREDSTIEQIHLDSPKSTLDNFYQVAYRSRPRYAYTRPRRQQRSKEDPLLRCTVKVSLATGPVIGVGDSPRKKEATKLAALSVVYQLHGLGLLNNPKLVRKNVGVAHTLHLSDGTVLDYDMAQNFMDFYCRKYGFAKPEISYNELPERWEAVMTVGGRRIGLGYALRKTDAEKACYLDVTKYLEECDPSLWATFVEAQKTGADLGLAERVFFQMSDSIDDQLRDLCTSLKGSSLYKNRPSETGSYPVNTPSESARRKPRPLTDQWHTSKSRVLSDRRQQYIKDPQMQKMRSTRLALPVYTKADELLKHIDDNEVTICMAATGSGKTTQIPQIILDSLIDKGQGSRCNIICTQPRRLAAISVADRVAKERGEALGKSIGYQVRFERRLPEEHGSITYCTTGVFLRKLQTNLAIDSHELDNVTHIVVDEVHERDVDTDLLLVVLKQVMADRKARNKPLKIILMSATIDPTLFQTYFRDEAGKPAKSIDIPGRSYPVTQSYLDDFLLKVANGPQKWILKDDATARYITKELGETGLANIGLPVLHDVEAVQDRELDLSYPLIAATISHILQQSQDGHVLVFLPGWDDIIGLQRVLESPPGPFNVDFNDKNKYTVHLLHSSIPLADQQVIFSPAQKGVRRIILATNIAETSVTIPDVVHVVDSARHKEQQYDPIRRITSLTSAWVGKSNLQQRAGRAGRHRPGEYYGILGRQHADNLEPYQTVEMKRVDLANVVMHIKALDFPGMSVEEVLSRTIEPPLPERVDLAIQDLHNAGALDEFNNLTSLGKVLLHLPVDARIGRLILYGSFFRCLDPALTIAALLSEREPFTSPLHLAAEASARKKSWTPENFRSDTFAALRAYNAWSEMFTRGEYAAANRFCHENFLSKPALMTVYKTRKQILQSLDQLGVMDVSAGGHVGTLTQGGIPIELNKNSDSLPLLTGLLAIAARPKFAVRKGAMTYRTSTDRAVIIHPKSVNNRKKRSSILEERQIVAFGEKRRNIPVPGTSAQTYLVNTTRLDPLVYMLFGAHKTRVVDNGLECDDWLPIVGNLDALDDIQKLKHLMEACMLRIFDGLEPSQRKRPFDTRPRSMDQESESAGEVEGNQLSKEEIRELDLMTHDVVHILNSYSEERIALEAREREKSGSATSPSPSQSMKNYDPPAFGRTTGTSKKSRRF